MRHLTATLLLAATLLITPPANAAADPTPIPCAPACEPPPCDPQTLVSLGQQVHQWRSRAEYLEAVVARKDAKLARRAATIDRLRARLHAGWS